MAGPCAASAVETLRSRLWRMVMLAHCGLAQTRASSQAKDMQSRAWAMRRGRSRPHRWATHGTGRQSVLKVCMGAFKLCIVFIRFLLAWAFSLLVGLYVCLISLLIGPKRAWWYTARPWARITLWLVGVRLRIEGEEHLRGRGCLYISNHQSLIDVVFLPAIVPPGTCFVAKRELLLIPLWGWGFGMSGAILIDRKRPREAIAQMQAGLRKLPRGWGVLIFPEGTRPKDGVMRPFKRGAFHLAAATHMPIVPIGMDGARDIVPPNGWLVRPGEVRVTIGPPLQTHDWDTASAAAHAAEGFAAVSQCVQASVARRPPGRQAQEPWASCVA
ncbi:MAG: 1-acyl-sn-glycerol-3-phosphate acyltransferase [Deltaproteobacteria bacterium]|nr:MAG: 1-acyl-sn-glycerol-3-phosphate acyltransferase [Deltaproteobacteria bacterium]